MLMEISQHKMYTYEQTSKSHRRKAAPLYPPVLQLTAPPTLCCCPTGDYDFECHHWRHPDIPAIPRVIRELEWKQPHTSTATVCSQGTEQGDILTEITPTSLGFRVPQSIPGTTEYLLSNNCVLGSGNWQNG